MIFNEISGSSIKIKSLKLPSIIINDKNVKIEKGNNLGFAKSFLTALDECDEADYYAFSDQDDVWEKDKLSTAIEILEEESLKELEAKNAKFIHFCVSDAQKAAKIIAATFHSKDFRLTDANNLYLYDMTLPVEKINRSFVESGIEIQEVHLCEDTLEDYFKKITGGEGIA